MQIFVLFPVPDQRGGGRWKGYITEGGVYIFCTINFCPHNFEAESINPDRERWPLFWGESKRKPEFNRIQQEGWTEWKWLHHCVVSPDKCVQWIRRECFKQAKQLIFSLMPLCVIHQLQINNPQNKRTQTFVFLS